VVVEVERELLVEVVMVVVLEWVVRMVKEGVMVLVDIVFKQEH
jgi:hypothetical protein